MNTFRLTKYHSLVESRSDEDESMNAMTKLIKPLDMVDSEPMSDHPSSRFTKRCPLQLIGHLLSLADPEKRAV